MKKFILALLPIILLSILWSNPALASISGLVIDEFRISGITTTDEYFVLANYGDEAISLKDFSIIKKTASGNKYTLISKMSELTIGVNDRLIFAHSNFIGERDFSYSTNSLAADNVFMIIDNNEAIVDMVGYGDAFVYEGSPLPNPLTGEIFARTDGKDSDNNLLDFAKVIFSEPVDPNIKRLVITEIMADPADGSEWFEIYNPTNTTICLYGLKVCDQLGSTKCYRFPKEVSIGPFGYLVFEQPTTKLTFNNDGDGLELLDLEENVIATSGNGYVDAIDGASFALFGSVWKWTTSVTKGGRNIFTDVIEIEKTKKKKSTKKTIVKKTGTVDDYGYDSESSPYSLEENIVKGTEAIKNEEGVSEKTVGWLLLVTSVIITFGYSLYLEKERLYGILKRFSR